MKKYTEKRPWGRFEQYVKNQLCSVKILYVEPNKELSLQYHIKRDEFLKVLQGRAEFIINNKTVKAKEGDEFFVSRKTKHRIIAQKELVKVLEISFGKFDEDDIVRLEDKYNRV